MARSFLFFYYLAFFFDTLGHSAYNQLHTFISSELCKLSSLYLIRVRSPFCTFVILLGFPFQLLGILIFVHLD